MIQSAFNIAVASLARIKTEKASRNTVPAIPNAGENNSQGLEKVESLTRQIGTLKGKIEFERNNPSVAHALAMKKKGYISGTQFKRIAHKMRTEDGNG